MRAARSIATSGAWAITTFLIVAAPLHGAAAASDIPGSFVIAQTSMGASDPLPPPTNPPTPRGPSTSPRLDYIPNLPPTPPVPDTPAENLWGAIGFTADGSYSSNWKMNSKAEAEAAAAKACAKFGRGGCEVASFSGQECVALATFIGSHRRRRWNLSFTAGGPTYPDAQRAALNRCNSDERTGGQCRSRTAACADGR